MKDEQHGRTKGKKYPGSLSASKLVPSDLDKQDDKPQKEKHGYGPGPAGENDGLVLNTKIQGIVAQ